MKKFMALLLAGVLCATAAYTALAVDDEEETTTTVVSQEEEKKSAEDILKALGDDPQAKEIAGDIEEAFKKGAAPEDVNSLLLALADYINGKGYDVAQIKNGSKTKDFVYDFLEDCGVDSNELDKAIKNFNEVKKNTSGNKTKNGGSSSVSNPGSSYGTDFDMGGSPEYYGVDSTTIPDTGFMG